MEERAPLPPIKPKTVFSQLFLSLTDFTVKNEKTSLSSLWDVGIDFSRRIHDAGTTEGEIKVLSVKTQNLISRVLRYNKGRIGAITKCHKNSREMQNAFNWEII